MTTQTDREEALLILAAFSQSDFCSVQPEPRHVAAIVDLLDTADTSDARPRGAASNPKDSL